jgi:DNA-binding NtrC family response regulator
MSPADRDRVTSAASADPTVSEAAFDSASPPMRSFGRTLVHAARHDAPVMLVGESGTGKTTFGRTLHALSSRAMRPFVRVDCRAACGDLPARAEEASTGTLFLDEVTDLSQAAQGAALRLLNDSFHEPAPRDLRIVASARHDLEVPIAEGRFRRDLFYRLAVLEIRIPPLRERPADILPIARAFVARLASTSGRPTPELSPALERALVAYSWPGNVGELWSVLERVVILTPGSSLGPTALPERMRS